MKRRGPLYRALRRLIGPSVDLMVDLMFERGFPLGMRTYLRRPMERTSPPIDLTVMAQFIATQSSAQFLIDHMMKARNCYEQSGLIQYAISLADVDGASLEFGVYKGHSINFIATLVDKVSGFDSFTGIDDQWRFDIHMKFFDMAGALPKVAPNVELIPGYFSDTLPPFVERMAGPVRFLHIDSDVYASAVTILSALEQKIVPGTVIVFDEYWNYFGWEQHEHRAFVEFIARTGKTFEYVGFASRALSVAVRILS